ncbi:sugar phosphate isomerase/epimerase [soil metagenome]
MKLGFVSAILADLSLEEVLAFAAEEGFACVELMCWPPGGADRRYAGVTHVDVTNFTAEHAARINDLTSIHRVSISGLGYYPNPLDPNPDHRMVVGEHLKKVIRAAALIGVNVVNTFIGRDPAKTVEANFELVKQVWPGIVAEAKAAGVLLGIEHCPMLFSNDEWPGGKNLPISPATWKTLFEIFPNTVGLNFDPSHLIWQFIDIPRAVRDFGSKIVHVHAKDERVDRERLHHVGVMGLGWHVPKLPGLGDVQWGPFFAALTDAGYTGCVSIEAEDRAYEGSLADRKRALRQSKRFLEQYMT